MPLDRDAVRTGGQDCCAVLPYRMISRSTMNPTFDDAVVGAGIVGLAHAFHLARRGRRVIVFERSPRACGASIRNFGMLWPIGQPAGTMHEMAHGQPRILARGARGQRPVARTQTGSLHLAYREDEAQVLAEFAERAAAGGYDVPVALARPKSSADRRPSRPRDCWRACGARPRPASIRARSSPSLPDWLAREFGVHFEFGSAVTGYEQPHGSRRRHGLDGAATRRLLGRRLCHALSRGVRRRRLSALQAANDALAGLRFAVRAGTDAGRRA